MSALRAALSALLVLVLSGASATAIPREDPPPAQPKNLQVLPKDIAPRSLNRLMKRYEQDLGVRCGYCHVENRDTGKLDYASDENPKKHTARIMIAMLDDINERHLAQLGGDTRYGAGVTCGSCHRGRANPQAWESGAP